MRTCELEVQETTQLYCNFMHDYSFNGEKPHGYSWKKVQEVDTW